MHRIRLRLPQGQVVTYRHLDLLHDALINAWTLCGAHAGEVIGPHAHPWTFAALGTHRKKSGIAHTLVISTPDQHLGQALHSLRPQDVKKRQAATDEQADFSAAEILPEPDPILPDTKAIQTLMLSPLAISRRDRSQGRWHSDLRQTELTKAVSVRLSRVAGRPVQLQIQPDPLYLKANPVHSTLVSLKGLPGGRHAYVIGMSAPLALSGSEEDLRLAWYAGIGEKTRNGFGCLGLLEQGVVR